MDMDGQIFVEPDGTAICVFVDAGLQRRPALVRSLAKAGAEIKFSANDARFILTDPATDSGRTYIREWGDNTIVLEARWASKCIQAGRLLLEPDNWGGCLAQDDGLNGDEHALPTPRETPSDSAPTAHVASSQVPSNPRQASEERHRPSPELSNDSRSHATKSFADHETNGHATQSADAPSSSQMSQFPSQANHFFPNPSQSPMPPFQQMPQFMQGPNMTQNMLQTMSQNNMFNGMMPGMGNNMMQAMMQSNMGLAGAPHMLPMLMSMTSDPNFVAALVDTMNRQQMTPQQLLLPSSSQAPMSSGEHHNPASTSPDRERQRSPSASSSTAKSNQNKLKGKAKAHESPASDSESEVKASIARPQSAASSSSSNTPLSQAVSTNLFKIDGKPCRFFVQIDLGRRRDVAVAIKKYGGKIVNQPTDADYAILNQSTKSSGELLVRAAAADTPALRQAFVFDSIDQGRLLSTTPYLLDAPGAPVKKRKDRPPELNGSTKPRRTKAAKLKETTQSPAPLGEASSSTSKTPSPSPPPASDREKWNSNHYKYTDAEQAYALRYAQFRLEKDYTTSNTIIAKKLHEKMPHHTQTSWSNRLTGMRDEIDKIRKRIGIARRKRESQNEARRSASVLQPRNEPPSETSSDTRRSPLEEDFERICVFFYQGKAENLSDDESWQLLASQHQCQTETSWPEFYNRHHEKIYAQLQVWFGSQSEGDPGQGGSST
ncbi:hypothetical protein HGRIS_007984 [Hohenbuehelia grisea]|uniref:BRCT domain-containing protein n=1 Tax=Hohenbuehelia grisea TaxID=104357 RepID=A0ABR3J714_9AGAR